MYCNHKPGSGAPPLCYTFSGPIVQCCALLHCFSKHDHHFHISFADSATVAVSHTKDDDSVTLQKLTSVSSDTSEPLSTPSFDPRDEEAL